MLVLHRIFFILTCFLPSAKALAAKSTEYGRLTYGGFLSQEKLDAELGGVPRNDFATFSARLYYELHFNKNGGSGFKMDLRDKHDFFDLLNKERKELSAKNDFQVRQLSYNANKRGKGFNWEIGRFSLQSAGGVFVDGGRIGKRSISGTYTYGAFAGLNPKSLNRTYLEYRPDSKVTGIYHTYQPVSKKWSQNLILSNALVVQTEFGHVDRQYLFGNYIYQWGWGSSFRGHLYLDFVPRVYIQNGIFSYNQKWNKKLNTKMSLLVMDIIQYRRNQDLRETLEASPYKELQFDATWRLRKRAFLKISNRFGKRSVDSKIRSVNTFKLSLPGYISKKLDMAIYLSNRRDFTKSGTFVGASVGYFTRKWELSSSIDTGAEKQSDDSTLHPIIGEIAVAYRYSRKFLGSFVYQNTKDENVSINTGFFRMNYRFGNKPVQPIRDGAAPRGRL